MNRRLTCIECPRGCALSVEMNNGRVARLEGHKCPKGGEYAVSEIENPVRILTSTVPARGLSLNMVPVKTDRPIPKAKIPEAMDKIRGITVTEHVDIGAIIAYDFIGVGANLVATRDCR